ncbi:MAG: carbohydrate-binding protein, partial [Bacteroidota bacterium]
RAVVDSNISEYSNTVSMTTDAVPVQSVSSIIEAEYFTQNDGTTPVPSETASGGYYLGSIEKDDSVAYQVNIPSSGTYTVTFRVANNSGSSKNILFKQGGNVSLAVIPSEMDWSWDEESILVNFVSSGEQTIWLEFEGGSGSGEIMRLDWLEIE